MGHLFGISTSTAKDGLKALGLQTYVENRLVVLDRIREVTPPAVLGRMARSTCIVKGEDAGKLVRRVLGAPTAAASGLHDLANAKPPPPEEPRTTMLGPQEFRRMVEPSIGMRAPLRRDADYFPPGAEDDQGG